MKRQFTLENIRPFSINATYYSNGRTKTSAAREWEMNIFHRLSTSEYEQAFKDLREAFDPKKHGFVFHMTTYYPEAQFFTKRGIISNKTFDLSNVEKILVDCMMLPKHALKTSPEGCQNLQIDDRYIVELQSRKKVTESEEPRIEVQISIVPL